MAGATLPILDSENLQVAGGRVQASASASAFGGLQAQAGQGLANALDKVSDVAAAKDEEFNQANALDLDNQLSARIRQRLYDPEKGYLATAHGQNAIDQRGQTEADLDTMAAEVGAQARGPQAAALYQRVARQRVDSALGQVASHATEQSNVYLNAQSESRIGEATDNAVAAFGDDAQVAANVAIATGEIASVARRQGMGEDWVTHKTREVQSDIYGRVLTQLATSDPSRAEAMFERIRPGLSAQEVGEMRTTMQVAQRQFVDNIEGQAWQAFANNQPLSSIGAAPYHEMITNPLLGQTHARLMEAYRTRAQSYANGSGRTRPDSPAFLAAQLAATSDPSLFLAPGRLEDYMATHAGDMAASDMSRLITMRQQMQQGAQDIQSQTSSFNALATASQAALAPYGIDLSISDSAASRSAAGSQAASRANAYRASLMRANQQFFQSHGRAPAGDEVQHVIGQAVLGMRDQDVQNLPSFSHGLFQQSTNALRTHGRPGLNSGAVAPVGATTVPVEMIPSGDHTRIATGLAQLLGRNPTVGEVQNFYAAELQGVAAPMQTSTLKPEQRQRIVSVLTRRLGHPPTDNDVRQAISEIVGGAR